MVNEVLGFGKKGIDERNGGIKQDFVSKKNGLKACFQSIQK
jgi:hypothetical protein